MEAEPVFIPEVSEIDSGIVVHSEKDEPPGNDSEYVLRLAQRLVDGRGFDSRVPRPDQVFTAYERAAMALFPQMSGKQAVEMLKFGLYCMMQRVEYQDHPSSRAPSLPTVRRLEIVRKAN